MRSGFFGGALGALLVAAGVLFAVPASAQNASNGYRLFQFTSALKGTAQSCAGCHGENPRMPPANAVDGFGPRNLCGQDWPAGTVHALKTFCALNVSTQPNADSIVLSAITTVPQMSQFNGVITAGERADIAAYLLAVYLQQAVAVARPEFQLSGTTTPIVSVDFGGVSDGATLTRVVHFVNSGTLALQIDAAFNASTAVSGLNAARFVGSSTLPAGETAAPCTASMTLAAGGRCAVAVTFSPDPTIIAGALQTAGLTIRSNGGSGTTQVTLNGSRVAAPAPSISLNPAGTTVSFAQTAGGQSTTQSITVTNSGTAPLNFTALELAVGANTVAGEFTRAGTCAVGTPVGGNGGTCTLTLGFSPAAGATGSKQATLQIASNAGATITLNLAGTVAGTGTAIGFGSSSHTNSPLLRLQSSAVGTAVAGTVTIRNFGTQPLTVTSVAVTTAASVFALTNQANCTAAPLAGGASCVVNIGYTPQSTAETVGEMTIASNGLFGVNMTPGPHVVRLEGIVVGGNSGTTTASISRSQVGFPSTAVNQTSTAQSVTINNTGAAAMQASFSGAGGANSSFVIVNGCANLVAAGSSCTMQIQFRPRSEGAKNETMNINYNGGSMSVSLSGVGQPSNFSEGKGGGGALPLGALLLLAAAMLIARRRPAGRG